MRIAFLDCFAGISGDMFLGALLDAGLPPHILHDATAALPLGATLTIEKVDRSGISSTRVRVLENGHLAEAGPHTRSGASSHAQAHSPAEQQPAPEHRQHPGTQHLHNTGHPHTHAEAHAESNAEAHINGPEEHTHGRSLTAIRSLIRATVLAEPVKNFALHTFDLLGTSEAKIHNVPVDQIHFHEVGAVDAIVDIVCASAGLHALNQQSIAETGQPLLWHSSPLNVGGGMVQCAHGNFPVPAPATADLLRGLPTYSAHLEKELVTPTGAAIIRALSPIFSPQPAMRVSSIGYGAGTRNPPGFPNVLRLSLGESTPIANPDPLAAAASTSTSDVIVLETALDDLSPQILAHVTEQALALGALDVMTTPVGMKKSRPGTLLTILTDEPHRAALEQLLLRETSTLGIRVHHQHRICLDRHHTTVQTTFGDIRIKIGSSSGEILNAAPEFEDCRAAALLHSVPVKQVLQAALAAYVRQTPEPASNLELTAQS